MFCWCKPSKSKKQVVVIKKLPNNVLLFNAKYPKLIHINNVVYCLIFNSDTINTVCTEYPILDCNYDIDTYEKIYSEWRYVIERSSFEYAQIILIAFTVLVTVIVHGNLQGMNLIMALKNIAIIGGLLGLVAQCSCGTWLMCKCKNCKDGVCDTHKK